MLPKAGLRFRNSDRTPRAMLPSNFANNRTTEHYGKQHSGLANIGALLRPHNEPVQRGLQNFFMAPRALSIDALGQEHSSDPAASAWPVWRKGR